MRRILPSGFVASRWLRWLLPAHLGVILLFIAGCGSNSSILDPQGPIASKEATLFWIILGVATFVFVAVEAVLIYSVFRFRERPGAPEPRQIHGNTRLEIIWTIVPSFVLFVVLGVTISTLFSIQEPTNDANNKLYVTAFGHQWWWEFRYFPNQQAQDANARNVMSSQHVFDSPAPQVLTADEIVVPMGYDVHVDLVSDNVIHSFWVPQLAGKMDVIPGHLNQTWFTASTPGTYVGRCTEFCGDQHAHMLFEVKVVPDKASYDAWVSQQQQPALDPSPGSLAAQGKELFYRGIFLNNQACISCHSVAGAGVPVDPNNPNGPTINAQGVVGPNLTHFGSRDLIAGGVLNNCPGDQNCQTLTQWLTDPQAVKPGNDMPYLGLSPSQVQALVAYLESLQ
ncbi:MAG TPA: cytochrome c oxidase subunit II [Ktedonobacterales bacterium]|nr:cytochrome c oxidase subunit II [Ktedonobacterales bacterium]